MAIALSKEKVQAQTGLRLLYSFLTLFLTNVVVIYLANLFFPAQVVLGTYAISLFGSLYHSALILTVIGTFVMPLVAYYEWQNKLTFTPKQWILTYFVVNAIAIWGITRFATHLGLGVSSWVVVVILAAALDWLQGLSMMALGKLLK